MLERKENIIVNNYQAHNQKWFLYALISIILAPTVVAFFPHHIRLILTLCYSSLIISGIFAFAKKGKGKTLILISGIISFICVWNIFFGEVNNFHHWAKTISLLSFFSLMSYHLYQKIAKSKVVYLDVIFASISGYLIIGIIGGLFFQSLELSIPNSFKASSDSYTLYDLQYFSFVTMTSLGFGDITPQTQSAKSLTLFIALAGQIYLTILVAILVGKFVGQKR